MEVAGRAGFLGVLVVALVSLVEGNNSLGALLALGLDSGETDGAGCLRGVVQVGQAERVVGPLLTVELDQLRVPLLGELPNNFAGDLHFYKHKALSSTAHRFHIY